MGCTRQDIIIGFLHQELRLKVARTGMIPVYDYHDNDASNTSLAPNTWTNVFARKTAADKPRRS